MHKFLITLIMSISTFCCANAEYYLTDFVPYRSSQCATMEFSNTSDYTLTIKILNYYGGLYSSFILTPHSSETVSFGSSATFKMKIKAQHYGRTSYHDGGTFNVTSNSYEYSQGEISFSMSTHGSGLGPSISAAEFARNN